MVVSLPDAAVVGCEHNALVDLDQAVGRMCGMETACKEGQSAFWSRREVFVQILVNASPWLVEAIFTIRVLEIRVGYNGSPVEFWLEASGLP